MSVLGRIATILTLIMRMKRDRLNYDFMEPMYYLGLNINLLSMALTQFDDGRNSATFPKILKVVLPAVGLLSS